MADVEGPEVPVEVGLEFGCPSPKPEDSRSDGRIIGAAAFGLIELLPSAIGSVECVPGDVIRRTCRQTDTPRLPT